MSDPEMTQYLSSISEDKGSKWLTMSYIIACQSDHLPQVHISVQCWPHEEIMALVGIEQALGLGDKGERDEEMEGA